MQLGNCNKKDHDGWKLAMHEAVRLLDSCGQCKQTLLIQTSCTGWGRKLLRLLRLQCNIMQTWTANDHERCCLTAFRWDHHQWCLCVAVSCQSLFQSNPLCLEFQGEAWCHTHLVLGLQTGACLLSYPPPPEMSHSLLLGHLQNIHALSIRSAYAHRSSNLVRRHTGCMHD